MTWIAVILGGFLAGVIAKALVAGDEPGGFIVSALIGIVGGVIGKLVMGLFGVANGNALWNLIVAVIGAVILLLIYHGITGSRRAGTTV